MDTTRANRSLEEGIRAVLSLRETVVLAQISEKRIRKDIEKGYLSPLRASQSRHCFRWPDVFFLAAVYRSDHLTGGGRQKVLRQLIANLLAPAYRREYDSWRHHDSWRHEYLHWRLRDKPSDLIVGTLDRMMIDGALSLDIAKVLGDVRPRVDLYASGLSHIEEKEGTLGGEAVFKNTRLSVRHIGMMSDSGEPTESILSDYPYLREDDVTFARLYHKAHPIVGRPRFGAEAIDVENVAG